MGQENKEEKETPALISMPLKTILDDGKDDGKDNKNSTVQKLKTILEENINNVKVDKAYIEQANAINDSVKNLLELAKLQVQIYKANEKRV